LTEINEIKSPKKKMLLWPWITLVALILVFSLVRLSLKTELILSYVKNQIEAEVSKQLNGELSIESISGDLLKNLTIKGVKVHDLDGNIVVGLDSLITSFNVWAIVRNEIQIKELAVYQPRINARENADASWNITTLPIYTSEPVDTTPSDIILTVESFKLIGGLVEIASNKLPDSVLVFSELKIGAGFRLGHEDYALQMDEFVMRVSESRLAQDIRIGAGAKLNDGIFTLDKLSLNTGATLLEAYLAYNDFDGAIELDAVLDPLSWRDILAYSEEPILLQDVRLSVGIRGNLSSFNLDLKMDALGMQNVSVILDGGYSTNLRLTSIDIQTGRVDLPLLTGDNSIPVVGQMNLKAEGLIHLDDYKSVDLEGRLTLLDLKLQEYKLDLLKSDFSISDSRVKIDLLTELRREKINSQLLVKDVFANPVWSLTSSSDGINPAIWVKNDDLNGQIRYTLVASGLGLQPQSEFWSIYANIHHSELYGQPFQKVELDIELSESVLDGKVSVKLLNAPIDADIKINNWMHERPDFIFTILTSGFNLSDFNEMDDFPTSINLAATGRGSGFDVNTMYLESNIVIEESQINGAELDRFQTMIFLDKQIINLNETFLRSTFAEGNLTVRQHLFNTEDVLNRVDFDLELLDIQPLAPLIGAEVLMASGNARGIIRTVRGSPEMQLIGSFEDIRVDSIRMGSAEIKANVVGWDDASFELDTRISKLLLGSYLLDDIWFRTAGKQEAGLILGNYRLDMELDKQIDFTMQSSYKMAGDSLKLDTSYLRLADGSNQYNLATDFNVSVSSGLVTTTPLILRGVSGVELKLQVEQYKEMAFRGNLNATAVDLEMMQKLAIDDVYILGKMTGRLSFDIDIEAEEYILESDIKLSELDYSGFTIDLVQLNASISNDRLKSTLRANRLNEEFLTFQADIPFKPGNPLEFDDEFFQEPVEGFFKLNPLNLSAEQEFLNAIGFENTDGILEASGKLGGLAGNPDLSGGFRLDNGRFSGVSIDSVRFDWDYNHSGEHISMSSIVVASGQKVAEIVGSYPLLIDWKTFNIIEPEGQSGISLSIITNDLDLTAFNQFLDQSTLRQLRGSLGAELTIKGDLSSPEIDGFIRLRQGAINLVPNNLNLRSIEANIGFDENRILVRNISAQSLGSFSASGEILMDGYSLQNVNLSLNARNLQVMNTRDALAILSFNTVLEGNVSTPKLTGNLTLDRGFIYLDNFGERTVEEVRLDDEDVGLLDDISLWSNLSMEIKVTTNRNFWVRNRSRPEIQLELNGELDLVKSKDRDIEVFGRMGVNDGYVTQLGKRFTFDQGDLTFSGNPANPALAVRTLYALRQPSDIKIWYVIGGTAEDPTFTYESDPEMELQDIVSYTVFGRPFHALMAWEQSVAGRSDAAVADAALDILLDRVEQLATERLGIDVLQIDNTRSGGNSGTTIKAGKFISDKLFVALFQEFGSYMNSQVIVEYELRRNLNLILTGSDSYHTGVDVLWKYDY
jgi:autotransporter translocation and assembly factor TamB